MKVEFEGYEALRYKELEKGDWFLTGRGILTEVKVAPTTTKEFLCFRKIEEPDVIELEIDWSGEGTVHLNGRDFDIELQYRYLINGINYRCVGFRYRESGITSGVSVSWDAVDEKSEYASHAIMEKVK